MPDLDRLTDQLRADMAHLARPAAADIRAAGDHRRRARTAAALTATAAAIVAIALAVVLVPGSGHRSAPPATSHPPTTAPTSPTAPHSTSPSPSASASASPSVDASGGSPVTVPPSLLLGSSDVGNPYTLYETKQSSRVPNRFVACGAGFTYPHAGTPIAGVRREFRTGSANQLSGLNLSESVLRFSPQAAHDTFAQIRALIASCGGQYTVQRRDFAGAESIQLHASGAPVLVQDPHGKAIYDVLIRQGRYLIWINLIDETHTSGQSQFMYTLGQHALSRLCQQGLC